MTKYDPEELEGAPDFGRQRRRNLFKLDGEVFEAAPGLPTERALEFIALADQWQVDDPARGMAVLRQLFTQVLLPESLERFLARLSDLERPIELTQLQPIIEFLFERFGMRPTAPSPDNSTGSASPVDGTSSPAGSSSLVSIPTASPSTTP